MVCKDGQKGFYTIFLAYRARLDINISLMLSSASFTLRSKYVFFCCGENTGSYHTGLHCTWFFRKLATVKMLQQLTMSSQNQSFDISFITLLEFLAANSLMLSINKQTPHICSNTMSELMVLCVSQVRFLQCQYIYFFTMTGLNIHIQHTSSTNYQPKCQHNNLFFKGSNGYLKLNQLPI